MADWTSIKKGLASYSSIILLTLYIVLLYSCTPKLRDGIYKGKESITISPGNKYWPGVFESGWSIKDSLNRQWFHEVIITVKGRRTTIVKTPFYVTNGIKQFTDSTGGYYYYKGDIQYDKRDKMFNIFCSLSSCKFCPRTATATPLYTHERYEIRRQKNKLVVKTNYEKELIFERQ